MSRIGQVLNLGKGFQAFTIKSTYFPNAHLRMYIEGSVKPENCTVSAQPYSGELTAFTFVPRANGYYAIESVKYPGAYLRMEIKGGNVDNCQVNCQDYIGESEQFKLIPLEEEDVYAIESKSNPGFYLRMDAKELHGDNPGGTINCSNVLGLYEQFKIEETGN